MSWGKISFNRGYWRQADTEELDRLLVDTARRVADTTAAGSGWAKSGLKEHNDHGVQHAKGKGSAAVVTLMSATPARINRVKAAVEKVKGENMS